MIHDIMRKPNSVIVLLYIIILRNGGEAFIHSVSEGNTSEAWQPGISAADIPFIMSSSQLIECIRPSRFFIVGLMYNKVVC